MKKITITILVVLVNCAIVRADYGADFMRDAVLSQQLMSRDEFDTWREEWNALDEIGGQPAITPDMEDTAKAWREANMPKIAMLNSSLMKQKKNYSKEDQKRYKKQESEVKFVEKFAYRAQEAYQQYLALGLDTSDFASVASAYKSLATSKDWKQYISRNERTAKKGEASMIQSVGLLRKEVDRVWKMASIKKRELKEAYARQNPQSAQSVVSRMKMREMDAKVKVAEERARRAESRASAAETRASSAEAAAIRAQWEARDAENAARAANWRLDNAGSR